MDLMRRMPPSLSQQALDSLLALLPAHSSELLSQSDQPLQVPHSALVIFTLFVFSLEIYEIAGDRSLKTSRLINFLKCSSAMPVIEFSLSWYGSKLPAVR